MHSPPDPGSKSLWVPSPDDGDEECEYSQKESESIERERESNSALVRKDCRLRFVFLLMKFFKDRL